MKAIGFSAAAMALSVLLGACVTGAPAHATPEATVMEFARALQEERYEDAYALMSSDYRARVSLEHFQAQLQEHPQEIASTADRLGQLTEPAVQRATVVYDERDGELLLEREQGRWLITTNVAGFYDQSTPRNALKAFVRAMTRRRYDVVMRLIPNADKPGITTKRMEEAWSGEGREEADRLINNLRNHIAAPIEIVGNRATMPYGDRMRVQFLREDGRWKIEDPE